jgi:hypothetical protein
MMIHFQTPFELQFRLVSWDIFSSYWRNCLNSSTNFGHFQDPDTEIEFHVSPAAPKGHFEDANVLGMKALRILELSINVDWKKGRFKLVKQ